MEKWGAENVRDWFWCVWNEPNNAEIGGGLSFYAYRNIYQEVPTKFAGVWSPIWRDEGR
jgi:hypothetical protein